MRRFVSASALGLVSVLAAPADTAETSRSPSPSPSPGRMFLESKPAASPSPELCGLLARCGLVVETGFCTPAMSAGVDGVHYDEARCAEARDLRARGVAPTDPVGSRLYRLLGRRYRASYTVDDRVALGEARLTFLMNDLPLAARLLTHFQKRRYEVRYLDDTRTRFWGRKDDALTGEAQLVAGSVPERRLVYFGRGVSKVAFWRLGGNGFLQFEFQPAPGGVAYRLKLIASPDNGLINAIMNTGLFKRIVYGHMREVLDDITQAAAKLARDGGAAIQGSPDWSVEEKAKIAAFLQLPGAGGDPPPRKEAR
jgi:hypothetical protein